MYCLSCKSHTKTKNEKESTSANGRKMLKGNCAQCGTGKNKFISSKPVDIPKPKKQKGGMYNQDNKREYPEPEFIEEKPKKMKAKKKDV